MCTRGLGPQQLRPATGRGPWGTPTRRCRTRCPVVGAGQAARRLRPLEVLSPPAQAAGGGQSQASVAHLSAPEPANGQATEKEMPARAHKTAPGSTHAAQRVLVIGLQERCADRWPPLPDPVRDRELEPGSARHRSGFSLPATRVVALLTTLVSRHGAPPRIRVDNGPELICQVLQTWCQGQGIDLYWIQPASPPQNTYIERFNGSFRRELLNAYLFNGLRQVREQCQQWQYDYNHLQPHQALNFLTPIAFRQAA